MTERFDLHVHRPVRKRGRLSAFAQARFDGVTVVADTLRLDDAAERRKFAEQVCAKLDGRAPSPEIIESRLLSYLPDLDILQSPDEDDDREPTRPSQADRLVEIAERTELFHDPAGDTYVRLLVDGHKETWPTRGKGFRRWLTREFYLRSGKAPTGQALTDALTVIEACAQFEGICRPVHVRVAPDGAGGIYLDLVDDMWRAIHLAPTGWQVVSDPPVCFRRPAGSLPLPEPLRGGNLDELRRFINSGGDSDWAQIKAWLIAAVRDRGPYPLLVLHGEQGTAKTTLARMLISLVDPSTPDLRSDPREARDLAIAAQHNWIVAFDNVSHLAPWLSDALCRLATGGGWATRQLYSDVDEVLFEAQRPVILTGITEFITRGDLLDRALQMVLPTISEEGRQPEGQLWAAFESARPRLLGALLDAVVGALRELPHVHLERLPRLADFALWAVAAERGEFLRPDGADGADGRRAASASPQPASPFLAAYLGTRAASWEQAIDASPIGGALQSFIHRDLTTSAWEGTAAELLERLGALTDEATRRGRYWPKSPRALSGELRRLAPALRGIGLSVELDIRGGHERRRLIRLAMGNAHEAGTADPSAPTAPTSSAVASADSADDAKGDPIDDQRHVDAPVAESAAIFIRAVGAFGCDPSCSDDPSDSPRVSVAATSGDLELALRGFGEASVIGIDCETTGFDPRRDCLRLVMMATSDRTVIVDVTAIPDWAFALERWLADPAVTKVFHHAKFDLAFLAQAGLEVENVFDTMLASQLLDGGQHLRAQVPDPGGRQGRGDKPAVIGYHSLAALTHRELGFVLDKTHQSADWSGPLTPDLVSYAAADAAVLVPLQVVLKARLDEAGLAEVAALEFAAVPALVWLEQTGMPLDVAAWSALRDRARAEQDRLAEQVAQHLPGVNLNSPRQLVPGLAALGVSVPNAQEGTLRQAADAHPVVGLLLAHKEAAKRVGTYGDGYLAHVHPRTGRIHADYHQIGAETGRMACARPNLQNVPRDPAYRACVRPAPGRVLVKADLALVELCAAAELAGDIRMVGAIATGQDLHRLTAAAVFGKDPESVSPDERAFGKTVNFGTLYGQGLRGLIAAARKHGLSLSETEARQVQRRFAAAWPDLAAWRARQLRETAPTVRTPSGRLRRLGPDAPGTVRVNTPVQGLAADGFKAALAELWPTRDRCPSAAPILAVHDELVVECDAEDAEDAAAWVAECLETGMRRFLTRVPVRVEVIVAQDWGGTPLVDRCQRHAAANVSASRQEGET